MQCSRARKTIENRSGKRSIHYCFRGAGKQSTKIMFLWLFTIDNSVGKCLENAAFARSGKLGNNVQENKLYSSVFVEQENNRQKIMFSWHSLLVILWENTWKMQRSLARENYRETFKKTGYSLAFSWCRVTCDELRVFLEFY